MKFVTKNKAVLLALLVFILAIFIYRSFFKPEPAALEPAFSETLTADLGADLVKLYGDLQRVKFDQRLFSSPGYLFLEDFSAELVSQPVGRPNPFAVIGND